MKKLYFLLLFMVCAGYAQQQPFITTWEMPDNPNFSVIRVPLYGTDNNYTVDFGDGTILTNQTESVIHIYENPGIYTMIISGDFHRIYFSENIYDNSENNIRSVEQWGDTVWSSMAYAFMGCHNFNINAVDVPNLSQVTDMSYMFYDCALFNSNINNWNVSNVTNMSNIFTNAYSFNQPLNNWDMSSVTNMSNMFNSAQSFNQPLSNWNVSSVTDMSQLFYSTIFNQPINSWNVENVMNMEKMFNLSSYDQPLDGWNVSNVINMESMFSSSVYNQPLNNWDVSSVTNMKFMFFTSQFNQAIGNWNVSNVTNMEHMFSYSFFNQPLNNWNVSNVINMSYMFDVNFYFNYPLNNWDVSNVINMEYMFHVCSSFNQPLSNWNISNVTNIKSMFSDASAFDQDISNWDFSNVQSFTGFLGGVTLNTQNYDALLDRFVQLNMQNFQLSVFNLKYCDAGIRNYLVEALNWDIQGDSQSEECVGNNVTGTMMIDENLNGCDAADAPAANFMVQATNNTGYNHGTFVNSEGAYNLRVQEDTYTVAPVNVPEYFTVTPASAEVTFTGFDNSEALNFCLVPNQTVQDLNITVLPIGDARPGFESEYKILIENIGTQTVSNATISLSFDNTLQSFVSAVPAPATTSANQLTFTLTDLGVFETKEVNLTMTTFQPPVVNGGEVAAFTAVVTPDAGDNTPDDNTFVLNQTIVNSYDPNDKRVVQGQEIYMEQTGEYLDYIIRFQNTGTASAITVRVEDTLSDNLDWATLKPIASSHAYRVEVTEGNKVNFIFDNINLPHEAADAEGSNGYIAYKVKPKQGIQLGDVIAGNAGIYFDFNLPIITNTVTTTVVEPLGVKQNTKTGVSIYPNPASTMVNIQPIQGTQVQQAAIYNLQGSELIMVNHNTQTLNISSLSAGVYLLQVQTNTGRATYRLVKK